MMGIASKENVGDSGMSTAKSGFKRALGISQKNSENVSSSLNRDAGKAITEKAGRQKAKSAAPAPAPKEANKGTQVSLFFHGFLQLHQCLTSPSLSPLSITGLFRSLKRTTRDRQLVVCGIRWNRRQRLHADGTELSKCGNRRCFPTFFRM